MSYCPSCLSSMFKLTSPKSCEFCDGMAADLIRDMNDKFGQGYREENVQFLVQQSRGHVKRQHPTRTALRLNAEGGTWQI